MKQRPANQRREVLFQLSDVARSMRTYIDQCAREHGMTRAQWGVLARLERQEGMTQAEMAEALEIQPISLVRLIDRLCEHGLVERRPHPRDRRANRLYLTEKGRTTLSRTDRRSEGRLPATAGRSSTRPTSPTCCTSCCSSSSNIRHAVGKRSARQRRPGKMAPGTSVMSASTFTQLRSLGRHRRLRDAVAAHRADGDRPGARGRRRLLFLRLSGRYVSTDNAYVGAQKVLITPEVSGKVVHIAVVEGQPLQPGDELFSIDPAPYRLRGAGGRSQAGARQERIRQPQELRTPAWPSRSSSGARASPPTRRTTTARPRCSTTASARPSDLDKSRMALLAAKAPARAAAAAGSDGPQPAARRHRPGDRAVSPLHGGDGRAASGPSAIWPIPCCARPSPASPRR